MAIGTGWMHGCTAIGTESHSGLRTGERQASGARACRAASNQGIGAFCGEFDVCRDGHLRSHHGIRRRATCIVTHTHEGVLVGERASFKGVLRRRQTAPASAGTACGLPEWRTEAGRAPKTINGELSVLRQVLKRAKLWYRFDDEYTTLRNRKPPVGRALTTEEQSRLFEVARTNPAWLFACVAATLSFYCGLRACEIEALRWQDIELASRLLHVRRSKTPAG